MDSLPRFSFPSDHHSETNAPTTSHPNPSLPRPEIHLRTDSLSQCRDSPSSICPRPVMSKRADSFGMSDVGAMTPPTTPSHSKTNSTSSAKSPSYPRRASSSASASSARRARASTIENIEENIPEVIEYPYWLSDYEDPPNGKKILGSGLWSDVKLARPCLPKLQAVPIAASSFGAEPALTPPITPTRSRGNSLTKRTLPELPQAYAIKCPASRSARKVLAEEAKILSYLSRFSDSANYIVPFYGQDRRTEALVLKAMPTTMEKWIAEELNSLSETIRAQKLATLFPSLALRLINGVEWMFRKGVLHADIKHSNILLSSNPSHLNAVYSDFSSALYCNDQKPPTGPLGGGTWDFLDPTLVAKASTPAIPSLKSDTWSLAVTLLTIVIGCSPFDCAGSNVFQRREMVKHGQPIGYAFYGDEGPRNEKRVERLSEDLGFDVRRWFEKVLVKDPAKRLDIKEWKQALERGMRDRGLKI